MDLCQNELMYEMQPKPDPKDKPIRVPNRKMRRAAAKKKGKKS